MAERKLTILLVGQTPPPYLGQAMMIERTLKGNYGRRIRMIHVRMGFSKGAAEIGKVKGYKILELLRVIFGIYRAFISDRPQVLYYFPAGPNAVPILRDIIILGCTRWLFKKTIFHFRASGLSEYYRETSGLVKLLMRWVYFKPDIGICLSQYTSDDVKNIRARKEFVLPNGIEDPGKYLRVISTGDLTNTQGVRIIFLGALTETKGVEYLLQACHILAKKGIFFNLILVGDFDTIEYKEKIDGYIRQNELSTCVQLTGVLIGDRKAEIFASADILCSPTFFHSEALPGIIIEAMSYALPVIATNWRGIPSLIEEGRNGFMVPIKDANALADKLEILIRDPLLRKSMGEEGRKLFLEKYTLDRFYNNLRAIFESLLTS